METCTANLSYKDLPDGQILMTVPTKFESLMTGCTHVSQDKTGKITLHYTDGKTESASGIDAPELFVLGDHSFLDIVSFVQP